MTSFSRRHLATRLATVAVAVAALGAGLATSTTAFAATAARDDAQGAQGAFAGKVFTSTNAGAGNEVLVYAHTSGGALALLARVATQGQGTGAALGSQGAVALSTDGHYLFVVNALSNTVSTFNLDGATPVLTSVVDAGGLMPTSVTEYEGVVYVLDAGGAGNVAGFRNLQGTLQPIAGSSRGLSAVGGTNPAQVGFGASGGVLVVTEKGTNRITSFPVAADGSIGTAVVTASSGATPFGFAFDPRNHLVVSEATLSTTSSYRFTEQAPAAPALVTASLPNAQAAACWVAVTPNGRYAYTANAGSNSLSSYRITPAGALALTYAVAGSTGAGAGATDLAVAPDGREIFAVAPKSLQIVSFRIGAGGLLAPLGAGSGLPVGSAGLAAN